jgi:hypothetical protein
VKAIVFASKPQSHYRALFQSIKGIVFLGTPHSGASLAEVAGTMVVQGVILDKKYLMQLRPSSGFCAKLNDEFCAAAAHLQIECFFETRGIHSVGPVPSFPY